MNEEIIRVLEMVKAGTITPQEGEKLISALTGNSVDTQAEIMTKKKYSFLRVRVDVKDHDGGETVKANVNIPLDIAKKATKLIHLMPKEARVAMEKEGIDISEIDFTEIIELFEDGEYEEDIVNVVTEEGTDGVNVRIYID